MGFNNVRCSKCGHPYGMAYDCQECKRRKSNPWPANVKTLDKALESIGKTLMPFGKHKGTPLYLIPDSYLEWIEAELLLDQNKTKNGVELLANITTEIKRRLSLKGKT